MNQKKVCLLGAIGVGKTSLTRQFIEGVFSERYLTTIGVRIDRKRIQVAGEDLNLIVWDLSGEDEFAQLETRYLRGASGYIVVADGTRLPTLGLAQDIQRRAERAIGPVPFIAAINKIDLEDEWCTPDQEMERLRERGWLVRNTSAKTGSGVDDLFSILGEKMIADIGPSRDPSR